MRLAARCSSLARRGDGDDWSEPGWTGRLCDDWEYLQAAPAPSDSVVSRMMRGSDNWAVVPRRCAPK